MIGDTRLGLLIDLAGKHRTVQVQGRTRAAPDLPGSTPLMFSIDPGFDRKNCTTWQDDANGTLETKIAEIVARVIVAGEAKFRSGLKEAEERAEQSRRWEEKRRQEAIAARNAERLKHLRESGDLLRRAEDLRALIARVRGALLAGSVEVDPTRIEEWERWASAEADRLDPIVSGQIMTHLAAPAEDG